MITETSENAASNERYPVKVPLKINDYWNIEDAFFVDCNWWKCHLNKMITETEPLRGQTLSLGENAS